MYLKTMLHQYIKINLLNIIKSNNTFILRKKSYKNILNNSICLLLVICLLGTLPQNCICGNAPGDTVLIVGSGRAYNHAGGINNNQHHHSQQQQQQQQQQQHLHQQQQQQQFHKSNPSQVLGGSPGGGINRQQQYHNQHSPGLLANPVGSGGHNLEHHHQKNSYNLLSEAMSHAVSHEFSSLGSGSADGACHVDDIECYSATDRLEMEAIRSLHRQLDDDDNGNIDLSESDDFLREELKYEAGYEKRQKAFHFNDDMHISVKELWEAWLRSEVHNWTIEQTTDWLAQSVQLPQYVDLFKHHKVTGAALPRLAVNNMHYVSNVLGIKDPIHKQKIALKAMDVVLFGPPRETGTRWKDYILVTLLLSAIIGCWYAYQQNKNAKRHLKRMAQDMEGLQKAEAALQEMQKELELARMEQENVATEKQDLERRLKEAPSISSSSSDLELQQLKQEIEMLRSELSRAEVELVDHCWSPPPQLQQWLQYTYELESKNHLKKRVSAEKQLQQAREACEKLRKKRSSLVGAFVSTHGKSIDDVDRSIVEARNSLSEVTNELQERLHRWKQIELMLGFSIVNNNGLPFLENVLYSRNGGSGGGGSTASVTGKSSRGRLTNSTDDLDDDSVQGMHDNYRNSHVGTGGSGGGAYFQDDSSEEGDNQSNVHFYLGSQSSPSGLISNYLNSTPSLTNLNMISSYPNQNTQSPTTVNSSVVNNHINYIGNSHVPTSIASNLQQNFNSHDSHFNAHHNAIEDNRSPSVSSERSIPIPPRNKKPLPPTPTNNTKSSSNSSISTTSTPPPPPPLHSTGKTPLPPPRKATHSQFSRSQSTDKIPMDNSYPNNTSFQSSSTTTSVSSSSSTATTISNVSAIGTTKFNFAPTTTIGVAGNSNMCPNINTANKLSKLAGLHGKQSFEIGLSNTSSRTTPATPTSPSSSIGISSNTIGAIFSKPFGSRSIKSTSSHRDTKQIDDTQSTDSSSVDDESKKRSRKLRFPFGKKSNKNKSE